MAGLGPPPMQLLGCGAGNSAAVLVIHSWWGLTGSFTSFGDALSKAGFVVGLVDLFDGKTAITEQQARALRKAPRKEPMYKTLGRCLEALRTELGDSNCKIGVVGFSMGGHWAVWLSQRPAYGLSATVLYYAARGGDFGRCQSSCLAHFAEEDPWVSKTARRGMERALAKAGCPYKAHDYPGTKHWFAEAKRPKEFNAAAAGLAFDRTAAHLRECVR